MTQETNKLGRPKGVKSRSRFGRLEFLLIVSAAILMTGCQTQLSAVSGNNHYAVNTAKAPFYNYGPAQAGGPDANLPLGFRMTVEGNSHGYSKVTLPDGQKGYVLSASLTQLPPEPPRRVAATGGNRRGGALPSGPRARGGPEPLFDISDVPAPLPEQSSARPRFRF